MAHTRIRCPSCKKSFRVQKTLRIKAGRCPRCQAELVLHSAGGKTTALLGTTLTNAAPQQAPAAPSRLVPVGDTAVDVPVSAPTRWDLQALA